MSRGGLRTVISDITPVTSHLLWMQGGHLNLFADKVVEKKLILIFFELCVSPLCHKDSHLCI